MFEATIRGVVRRLKPSRVVEGNQSRARFGEYGELMVSPVMNPMHMLADEGSYFVTVNPTISTAILPNAVETAFADTRGFFVIGNTASPSDGGAKSIYLDFLQLLMSGTAPATTTVQHFAGKRSAFSREPTTAANRTLLSPANVASDGPGTIARVMAYANAGAMTVPASSGADPVVFRTSIPTSLGITGDNYILKFGALNAVPIPTLTAVRATAPATLVVACPPVVLRPGDWLVIHRWWLTESAQAPAFEYMLGHYER